SRTRLLSRLECACDGTAPAVAQHKLSRRGRTRWRRSAPTLPSATLSLTASTLCLANPRNRKEYCEQDCQPPQTFPHRQSSWSPSVAKSPPAKIQSSRSEPISYSIFLSPLLRQPSYCN